TKSRPVGLWSLLISGRKRTPQPAGGGDRLAPAGRKGIPPLPQHAMNAIDHFVMDITSAKAIARYAAAVRTVSSYRAYGSSRPLNEGNTQDQFACRCRRCIGHGQRDWSLGYWGRATVSADDRIAAWLEAMGLGHSPTVFAGTAIDLDVLPAVTKTDLEKLGVALGHRNRILRAIAALSGAAAAAAAPAAALSLPQSEAERRQLTVLFCDLV